MIVSIYLKKVLTLCADFSITGMLLDPDLDVISRKRQI